MKDPSEDDGNARRKVRVSGSDTLSDVARVVFADVRLVALLSDLNPGLSATGPLAAGSVVICPSKIEARAFANKMGFTLGFDEKASNGTKQKRAWAKMNGPSSSSRPPASPEALATQLQQQGLSSTDVGRRLASLCAPSELEHFVKEGPAELSAVRTATAAFVAYPQASARLLAVSGVLEATLRPAGLRGVLEALDRDEDAALVLLGAIRLSTPLREALQQKAPVVARATKQARALARLDRGARDAALDDADPALRALVAALVDGVEPVAGERLDAFDLGGIDAAFREHVQKLKDLLKRQADALGRAPIDVIRALAAGETWDKAPPPWPLVLGLARGLAAAMATLPVSVHDLGLGGLVPQTETATDLRRPGASSQALSAAHALSREAAPVVSAASLQARAASGAKTVDEGSALAERIAPIIVALHEVMRPISGDVGPMPLRRARRRSFFAEGVTTQAAVTGDGIARLVAEVLREARRTGVDGADRLERPQVLAAQEAGRALVGTLSQNQKPMSELGRALVVSAMALDRDLGGKLLRATGREAFVQSAERYAARVLSKAGMLFCEPESSQAVGLGGKAARLLENKKG